MRGLTEVTGQRLGGPQGWLGFPGQTAFVVWSACCQYWLTDVLNKPPLRDKACFTGKAVAAFPRRSCTALVSLDTLGCRKLAHSLLACADLGTIRRPFSRRPQAHEGQKARPSGLILRRDVA